MEPKVSTATAEASIWVLGGSGALRQIRSALDPKFKRQANFSLPFFCELNNVDWLIAQAAPRMR
ncbi:MAG: hypothetical protein Aurels2KO_55890 [Aureliella sp.]